MQRIKLQVFKSWFEKNLTGNEIDFLIALSFYQNERGVVHSVYYKDMIEETGMSVQAFYDCKKTLAEKGVISVTGIRKDYTITIIGNDFTVYTQDDYNKGEVKYLTTNSKLFHLSSFRLLQPKLKLLVMDLYNIQRAGSPRGAKAFKIGRKNFIKRYANVLENGAEQKGLLNVTARTLQKYMQMVRLFFTIVLRDGMYYIILKDAFRKQTENESAVEMEYILKTSCRRNKIKAAANKEEEQEWKKVLEKLILTRKQIQSSFVEVHEVMQTMIERLNQDVPNRRKWKRRLKDTLFRQVLNEVIA